MHDYYKDKIEDGVYTLAEHLGAPPHIKLKIGWFVPRDSDTEVYVYFMEKVSDTEAKVSYVYAKKGTKRGYAADARVISDLGNYVKMAGEVPTSALFESTWVMV